MTRTASRFVLASFLLLALIRFVDAQQPSASLRIVVLAGEDSVNVIQQKTAVAPLIEVRDRNNNPVAGAVVRFAVQGGKSATFQGGASTITVATNAAGQAAATGLTPLSAGAVNISVEAAFQGQIASAAISQVNVLTAAEAAAAAGGASGAGGGAGSTPGAATGGGAAGGGGLSATTIGIIGGAVAAGAVAGTQVLSGPPVYSGTFAIRATVLLGLPNGGVTCTRQEVMGGILEVELEGGDAINGNARIKDAYSEIVVNNCGGSIGRTGNWGMPDSTVRGSASALAFEASDSVPAIDNSGQINRIYKFNGSVTGDTITGTFELSLMHQVTLFRFIGGQQVTLQKQ